MTDFRCCDGPSCSIAVSLSKVFDLARWITLDRGEQINTYSNPKEQYLHFHNDKCLVEWTRENNRGTN